MAPLKALERDFSKAKPVSDEVFAAYKSMYQFPDRPLNAKLEGVVEETSDWKKEKITFDSAYGGERVTAYLYLPRMFARRMKLCCFSPVHVSSISRTATHSVT